MPLPNQRGKGERVMRGRRERERERGTEKERGGERAKRRVSYIEQEEEEVV